MEESTTFDKDPPQDKLCHSGRFLGSHSFARNDMSEGDSVLSAQVVIETWRAANSRPYIRNPSAPIVPTVRNVVPRLIHRLWRSPFPEGEGLAWFRSTAQVIFVTLLGDESSPLHWVYRVLGNTIQPHRLYSKRGGRQILPPLHAQYHSTARYIFATPTERHAGRSLRFR